MRSGRGASPRVPLIGHGDVFLTVSPIRSDPTTTACGSRSIVRQNLMV